jgi:sialate O-acetylesterase
MKTKLSFLVSLIPALFADVRLPALISDHMLLQRGAPARVFGWADPGEQVTVQYRGQTVAATANENGKWHVWLSPMEAASEGADLVIRGRNSITIEDVLVGEVWIGSGQSNMQWTVRNSNNPDREIAEANYSRIRLFQVALTTQETPQDDVKGKWMVCSPEMIANFSAVGYFFSRGLHKKLGVPIGFIQSAWGGTPAQAWTSRKALYADTSLFPILGEWNRVLEQYPEATEKFKAQLASWESNGKSGRRPVPPMGPGHSHTPAGLYNAMIHPLTPYTIQGAIWYQGESNASKIQAPLYRRLFETMIHDWRRSWGQGEFPFLFVQLANFAKAGSPSDWVLVQEAQLQTLGLRRTGMAVINDIGEADDIHPKNKQDVAERLALAARHIAYGEQLVYSGPRFRQATGEGAKMRVWFDSVGGGLKARGGGDLKGFELAGPDGEFHAAEAKVEGATLLVSSPTVTSASKVRYAWASNPDGNLINAAGLPASLFRSE